MNADNKAVTLAFLVDELVSSTPIIRKIDHSLTGLANLRRDKWVVEGKIRQLVLKGKFKIF